MEKGQELKDKTRRRSTRRKGSKVAALTKRFEESGAFKAALRLPPGTKENAKGRDANDDAAENASSKDAKQIATGKPTIQRKRGKKTQRKFDFGGKPRAATKPPKARKAPKSTEATADSKSGAAKSTVDASSSAAKAAAQSATADTGGTSKARAADATTAMAGSVGAAIVSDASSGMGGGPAQSKDLTAIAEAAQAAYQPPIASAIDIHAEFAHAQTVIAQARSNLLRISERPSDKGGKVFNYVVFGESHNRRIDDLMQLAGLMQLVQSSSGTDISNDESEFTKLYMSSKRDIFNAIILARGPDYASKPVARAAIFAACSELLQIFRHDELIAILQLIEIHEILTRNPREGEAAKCSYFGATLAEVGTHIDLALQRQVAVPMLATVTTVRSSCGDPQTDHAAQVKMMRALGELAAAMRLCSSPFAVAVSPRPPMVLVDVRALVDVGRSTEGDCTVCQAATIDDNTDLMQRLFDECAIATVRPKLVAAKELRSDGDAFVFKSTLASSAKHRERVAALRALIELIKNACYTDQGRDISIQPFVFKAEFKKSEDAMIQALRAALTGEFADKRVSRGHIVNVCQDLLSVYPSGRVSSIIELYHLLNNINAVLPQMLRQCLYVRSAIRYLDQCIREALAEGTVITVPHADLVTAARAGVAQLLTADEKLKVDAAGNLDADAAATFMKSFAILVAATKNIKGLRSAAESEHGITRSFADMSAAMATAAAQHKTKAH